MGKRNISSLSDSFESEATKEHDTTVVVATEQAQSNGSNTRATALVSMTKAEKERLTGEAKEHGLSLSAFLQLAVNEYMKKHN